MLNFFDVKFSMDKSVNSLRLLRHREMTWGSVGVTMAHELSHSYLPPGTKFDAEGEENEWWTSQSNHRFEPEEKCFIETFGKLKMFNQSVGCKAVEVGKVNHKLYLPSRLTAN